MQFLQVATRGGKEENLTSSLEKLPACLDSCFLTPHEKKTANFKPVRNRFSIRNRFFRLNLVSKPRIPSPICPVLKTHSIRRIFHQLEPRFEPVSNRFRTGFEPLKQIIPLCLSVLYICFWAFNKRNNTVIYVHVINKLALNSNRLNRSLRLHVKIVPRRVITVRTAHFYALCGTHGRRKFKLV